ncbi:MAG: tRNA (N6-isopentenyl adenosine(37)-C2)-methylthiotransferase MiaB [Bacteroidia bacterium]|nr:tRNA (N6-isopentenyl adenosine(37)-C2)-methylthiotransferase MiaB [Bacteroidia bacterium]MCC7534329.1 tRNA (N6-isopentenyl adenosine(37)-C2)-methylthiotransferase MiaB [Bacteroidia bacterium]MCZ2141395.1 tRNA (N6-isopentenyl adenosine(37)-C2)-methylthiotransferase MiaB [Bacteroidia bacterium]
MRGLVGDIPVETAKRNLYIETYGCAMNVADSEVVASIMGTQGFKTTNEMDDADVIFINTCAVRDNAEARIWGRLREMRNSKKQNKELIIGVLGCMAERLKKQLMEDEKIVDLVVGPDAYRDLPKLLEQVEEGNKAVNVLLSREETYAEITPVRLSSNGVTAFVSIMRGCDNMCAFCVVPFTRGRERSRDPESIYKECVDLFNQGFREVTLLGQNVDSYKYEDNEGKVLCNFAQLLEKIALINPALRIRFSSSHPKDITDEVLFTIKKYNNICNYIHYPLQSGSSRILKLMNRTYDADWFRERLARIREIIPDCGISTDVIAGFCTETDEDHQDTLKMFEYGQFDFAYMYQYSERPGTLAARKYADDVPLEVKNKRLNEIIKLQNSISVAKNQSEVGNIYTVLIEGYSKKSDADYAGRNDQNKTVIFPVGAEYKKGDYVKVLVERSTQTSLIGKVIEVVNHP